MQHPDNQAFDQGVKDPDFYSFKPECLDDVSFLIKSQYSWKF
jgi:hypothetical protein